MCADLFFIVAISIYFSLIACISIVQELLHWSNDRRVDFARSERNLHLAELWQVRLLQHRKVLEKCADEDLSEPIAAMCKNGIVESLEEWLAEGGSINTVGVGSGCSLLHVAAIYGQMEIIRCLVRNGIDTNICSNLGATALQYSIWQMYENISLELVASISDKKGFTNDVSNTVHAVCVTT